MTQSMKGWVLRGIGRFQLEDIDLPELRNDEVLVRVRAAGVCGSDIPRIFQLGTRVTNIVLGHEFAGDVVAVAREADQDLVGRRAAVFPLIPCWECGPCMKGRYVQCQNYGYMGSRRHGGFAEYCIVPSRWHILVSDASVEHSQLAMVEPSSVARHAVRIGGVVQGDLVLVFGAGSIGMVVARWIRAAGATAVIVDIDEEKLEFARRDRFTAVMAGDGLFERLQGACDGAEPDVVIEGTGAGSSLSMAARVTKPQGTIVLLGNPHSDTLIELHAHSEILRRELTLKGAWNSEYLGSLKSEWTDTLAAMSDGSLVTQDLISHPVALGDLGPTLDQVNTRSIRPWKVMVVDGA